MTREHATAISKSMFPDAISIHCTSVQRAILSTEQWSSAGSMSIDALNVIIKGSAWIILDGEEYHIGPGDAVFMMQGTSYSRGIIESDHPLEVLWIVFDACFSEQLRLFSLYPPPKCLTNDTAGSILRLARGALCEWRGEKAARGIRINGLVLEMLALAYRAPDRHILRPRLLHPRPKGNPLLSCRAQIRRAVDYIGAHFREPVTFQQILAQTPLASGYFCRQFRAMTGMSPMRYLEHVRITEAAHLLVNTATPVKTIAIGVGYADPYHFSRVFSRVKKMNPSRFRQKGVLL